MNTVRVVLIDDEVHVLAALVRVLRQGLDTAPRSLAIETYGDPRVALARLQERAVDLVICDYRMPGLDGVSLLSRVALSHPDTARVLLTGSPDLQAVLAAVNSAGVSHVLLKPWDDAELLAVAHGCLRVRDARLEQQRLADASRHASGTLSAQELERRRLEAQWPGITQVEWTADGAVQFGDTGLAPLDPQMPHEKR